VRGDGGGGGEGLDVVLGKIIMPSSSESSASEGVADWEESEE